MNNEKIRLLSEKLRCLVNSKLRGFDEIRQINEKGVYAIYEDGKKQPIYIGKSKKRGVKHRMSELTGDFRSHTLNRKILFSLLKKDFNFDVDNKKKTEVYAFIDRLSKDEKMHLQNKVNDFIRKNFKIKFIPLPEEEIESFEHFAIGVENPEYND